MHYRIQTVIHATKVHLKKKTETGDEISREDPPENWGSFSLKGETLQPVRPKIYTQTKQRAPIATGSCADALIEYIFFER